MFIRVTALCLLTIKEGVRHRVLSGIGLMAVMMAAISLLLPNMFSYDLRKIAIDLGLSAMLLSGLMIIFFLAVNILGRDIDKRTIYLVLATQMSRLEYIVGKFLGIIFLLIISFSMLSVLLAIVVYGIMELYPSQNALAFSWNILLLAQLFMFFELVLITAIVFFFSSFTSSFYLTVFLSGVFYVIGTSLENIQFAMASKSSQTTVDVGGFIDVIKWLFPNLSAFDLKTVAAYGLPLDPEMLWITGLYGLIYVLLLLFFTALFFNKRELA